MAIVIVPNSLRDAINQTLDAAYQGCPDAAIDRDQHYHALLSWFNDHGEIPEFELKKGERE